MSVNLYCLLLIKINKQLPLGSMERLFNFQLCSICHFVLFVTLFNLSFCSISHCGWDEGVGCKKNCENNCAVDRGFCADNAERLREEFHTYTELS